MAKRKRASSAKNLPDAPVRICFERIVPDEMDPERAVRRAYRAHLVASADHELNPEETLHVARMALINSKKWATWSSGFALKCRFLDGSATMQKKVEAVAHRWEDYANIKLKFVKIGTTEIRISFYADAGSWSAVGRDALNQTYFPPHQPTMNYGWLRDDTKADEYSRVVLHEFGHALGCIHEHQGPKFSRRWDEKAVMKYFQGPPNYWTPAEIKHNVLQKYSPKGISATQYDPKSIMLYAFDGALFADGKGPTNTNRKLSTTDIQMIHRMYP
jgi:serralysin